MNSKPRMLYVDDEAENLVVFKAAFNKDFEITTVTSALEALALLEKGEEFNIIVSDQRMPEMTGVEFFQKIQEGKDGTRILLTGYADMQAIIDAVNHGKIYYYCTKPWSREELKLILTKALQFFQLNNKNKLLAKLKDKVSELESINRSSLSVIEKINDA